MSQSKTTYHINGMVCDRCVMAVRQLADELNIVDAKVEMGQLIVPNLLSERKTDLLRKRLEGLGFELSQTDHQKLVSQINSSIVDYIQRLEDSDELVPFSEFVSSRIAYHYNYASRIYMQQVGESVEQALIKHKIDRVKSWLKSGEHTLSEIAWQFNYSSVQYLSNQFKKVTGETVTEFRKAAKV